MKKIYLIIICFFILCHISFAQTTTLIYNGFDNYNGLPASVAPGWYYSFNDSTTGNLSFYNSNGLSGDTLPSYKFGFDSTTIISPAFIGADSLRFWMKGNGTVHDSNTFEVYVSVDSVNWTLLISIDSISASGKIISLPVANNIKHVKFFYRKLITGYNVGLDDIYLLKNTGPAYLNESNTINSVNIFPTPTTGSVNVVFKATTNADIKVYDLLGNTIRTIALEKISDSSYLLNLTGQSPGFYFIRIKTADGSTARRIRLQ